MRIVKTANKFQLTIKREQVFGIALCYENANSQYEFGLLLGLWSISLDIYKQPLTNKYK